MQACAFIYPSLSWVAISPDNSMSPTQYKALIYSSDNVLEMHPLKTG